MPPWDVAFHPSGKQLVVARDSETPGEPDLIWDPQPLRLRRRTEWRSRIASSPAGSHRRRSGPESPVFSADGRTLAAAFDGAVAVWDTAALAEPRQWIPVPIGEPAVALQR